MPLYSDLNKSVKEDQSASIIYDEDAIKNSILTILGTRKGQRVMNRDFGSYLSDLLFEPLDDITAGRIKRELIQAIGEWENRVELKEAEVIVDKENQQFYVRIMYFIPGLNKSSDLNFNLKAAE